GRQRRRAGPGGLRGDSATSHAEWGTVDRRSGDGGLPGCEWPAAAAAERLGRQVQEHYEIRMIARFASLALLSLALFAAPAAAQGSVAVVAVPPLTTPDNSSRGADSPAAIAWQASQLIASDLRSTSEL